MGKSDPYVKLKLTEDKHLSKKTSVKKNNLNPEWNEEFKLVVKDPGTQALELNVYDWEQACDVPCICSFMCSLHTILQIIWHCLALSFI